MQANRNLFDEIGYQFKQGTMTTRLIIANFSVFLVIQLIYTFLRLMQVNDGFWSRLTENLFTLDTHILGFILKPWGLFTSIFAHFSVLHILMNMLFLYFSGQFFESIFDRKRLWYTYVFGGIFGGLLEILAHLTFPALQSTPTVVVGASGSIMAIFTALAFYSPNTTVQLFGVFPVKIYIVALLFLVNDIIGLGSNDSTAHFAHLGGALFGILSIQNLYSSTNVINVLYNVFGKFNFSFLKRKEKLKPMRGGKKSDEAYNVDKKERQQRIDAILDKISKSGYEALTKEEKAFLFDQSKRS